MKVAIILFDDKSNKWNYKNEVFDFFIEALFKLSKTFDIIGWCYFSDDEKALLEQIKSKKDFIPEMVTFGSHLFGENAEYLEASNVYFNSFSTKENHSYDTWRIRSNSGYISTSVLNELKEYKCPNDYKTSLAVLAFSVHKIGAIVSVSNNGDFNKDAIEKLNNKEYGVFLSYTKKRQWLIFNSVINLFFNKKIFFSFKNYFSNNYQKYNTKPSIWRDLEFENININQKTVDIVIPTLGRPNFVYDTLKSINKLDYKFNDVHIIEQKLPDQKSTILEKSINEDWHFSINHILLDKLGLCNARNIGFKESKSDYIIMFDDDILIDYQPQIIENLIYKLEISKSKIISFASNNKKGKAFLEMSYFVSGCSFMIKNDNISPFSQEIEGMGADDQEYNYSIRNNYQRVVYTNEQYINHLRAPMGGWRFDAKTYLPWYHDNNIDVLPGVATIYRYLKYATKNQLKGYKFFTFYRYYGFNIFKYFTFNKKWNKSILWATKVLEGKVQIDVSKGIKKE